MEEPELSSKGRKTDRQTDRHTHTHTREGDGETGRERGLKDELAANELK